MNSDQDNTTEFRPEYRHNPQHFHLKPFVAVAGTASGRLFAGVDVMIRFLNQSV
ncbi:hypothetical protein [uncultured Thiohalocapsa sp.]|uniref:hypothetical protein n=1 Tax=uncultured Thiohalocapsa sp. TaxID=768990 RepID=UPI0025F6E132|nr:hypothetical protein [uncultured Thiohalocapsa sp.]